VTARPATPITKLLVANRGEIARRVMRTARALGLATVAVHSDPDAASPFVAEAGEAVRLPGATPEETYLDAARIVAAAGATGATAVHPGYGFLSENADFARACARAGLVFVGPGPEAIEAMGSKVRAKELMAAAGVPVLPGATVATGEDVVAAGERLGWPLLVKAAHGGGGRGMRVVKGPDEAAGAVSSARHEATAAFGDPTLLVERFLEAPRHVEVQILGDTHGNLVHLFERECSIQRRYQKIVEECPSPAVDARLRAELGAHAVAAARAIGYVGAGTVEFVLDEDGRYYFLEVNTRLQVEHPVTEAVTGLDLVALQLAVAAGEPLPPAVLVPAMSGHAIEARLYAEDVEAGYLPVAGPVHRFEVAPSDGVRVDSGVESGTVVGTHYDAMLAKVIAWGPDRATATHRLAESLGGARLHGLVTNRDLLVGILRSADFARGRTDTAFLTRNPPASLSPGPDHATRRVHAVAAVLAARAGRRSAGADRATRAPRTAVHPGVPAGWRNVGEGWHETRLRDALGTVAVAYRLPETGHPAVRVDGEPVEPFELVADDPGWVELVADGVRRRYQVAGYGNEIWVDSPLGATRWTEVDPLPAPERIVAAGSLLAPMPGAVLRVLAEPGAEVAAGDVLVVLEAMKMEHPVRSDRDGVVEEVRVSPGQQVENGSVLVVVGER
jgi:acetyl/propionyl-CoA carboxylase alpha subunit